MIPVSFWFFSIGGGLTLLVYAVYRMDPVFILGQGAGLFVYLRNLYLIRREAERPGRGSGVISFAGSGDYARAAASRSFRRIR